MRTIDAALFDNLEEAVKAVAEMGGGIVHSEMAATMYAESLAKKYPGVEIRPKR